MTAFFILTDENNKKNLTNTEECGNFMWKASHILRFFNKEEVGMEKKKQWMRVRHKIATTLLRPVGIALVRLAYGIKIEKFHDQGDRSYLIVMNHQTAFDQFFVTALFKKPVYYIASEDLFSKGFLSRALEYLVAPIPIKKQTLDLQAVKNCIKVAREGGSIALAPEGNRTYHGRTLYMKPGIASLVKKLGMPLAIMRIEGGYGVHPRWSDVFRRGAMRCYISRVVEPEEYASMTGDDLFELIKEELWVDEGKFTGEYRHKKNAEFLERAMYVCPWCGLSAFESHDDIISCTKCGRQIRHKPTKELEGVGFEFPHRFVADWYDAQCAYVNNLNLTELCDAPLYEETAKLSKVQPYKNKKLLKKSAKIRLYGDRIILDGKEFHFDTVSAVVVLGKNKLNIYCEEGLLQLKGSKRFNALKYVNLFHRYQNIKAGKNNEFLGL